MSSAGPGSFSSIFGEESGKMPASHQDIADKLLEEGFLLTALEFHTELLESGKELKSLKEFFANSGNFVSPSHALSSPESQSRAVRQISRSESQGTLDSIDRLTRYSEDTDRREEDRLAVLEYELRTARETITQLRSDLQELTKQEQTKTAPGTSDEAEKDQDEEEFEIKAHEKKFLNYLVNDYLMRNGYKFTAVTFSDECDEQNFDDWEEVSSYSVGTPTILSIYRNSGFRNLTDRSNLVEADCQTTPVKVVAEEEWQVLSTEREKLAQEREELQHQVEAELKTNTELREDQGGLTLKLEDQESFISGLRSQLSQLETEKQTLADRVRELTKMTSHSHHKPPTEHDLNRPDLEREDGDGASIIDEPLGSPSGSRDPAEHPVFLPKSIEEYILETYSEIPRPFSELFQKTFLKKSFPISINDSSLGHIDISDLLATTLPKLISNLVLSSRIDIVPLLLHSISCQKDGRTRESLIGVLFNLMKRPDEPTRERILQGLLWLVHQPGWGSKRIEAELLPQCLEQMNQKYNEKKILVAQSISVLAGYIDRTLRSSLLISMILQLVNDKDPVVVIPAIRSLAVLINLVEADDKMEQVYNVVVLSLTNSDTSEEILEEIQGSIMPVLNVWMMKTGQSFRLVESLLGEIENSPLPGSLDDTAAVVEAIESQEKIVRNLRLISGQMRSVVFSVISKCQSETSLSENQPDQYTDTFYGEEFHEKSEVFNSLISQDWFQAWPEYDQMIKYLSRLSTFFKTIPPQDTVLIDCSAKLLSFILELTGSQFSQQKVFPLMESSIARSNGVLSVFCISLMSGEAADPSHAMSLMKTWLVRLAGQDSQTSPLLPFVNFLCRERRQSLVIESLRESVADPSPEVRCEVGQLLEKVLTAGSDLSESQPAVSRMLVPALVSLTSDPVTQVKISAGPALFSLLRLAWLDWEERERLGLQVSALLEAEEEEVAVVSAHSLALLLSSSEEETRDQLLLPSLCRAAARSSHTVDTLTSILACFTVISELQLPGQSVHYHHNYHLTRIISLETLLSGFVLPAMSGMLETVQIKFPELQPSVLTLISDLEASRKISPRGSSSSGSDLAAVSRKDKRDSISSLDPTQSGSDRMKEKVNKLFSKQSNIQFWKK